jgi:alcohol dehydrogenase (cytochrome c)
VFYGNQGGDVKAVNAKTGEILWTFNAGSGVMQSPMTFSVDGKQYIAIVAGRSVGVPSFFGKIGEKVVKASTAGGHVIVLGL